MNHKYPCFLVVLGDPCGRVVWPPKGHPRLRTTAVKLWPLSKKITTIVSGCTRETKLQYCGRWQHSTLWVGSQKSVHSFLNPASSITLPKDTNARGDQPGSSRFQNRWWWRKDDKTRYLTGTLVSWAWFAELEPDIIECDSGVENDRANLTLKISPNWRCCDHVFGTLCLWKWSIICFYPADLSISFWLYPCSRAP